MYLKVGNQTTGTEPSIDSDVDEIIWFPSNRSIPEDYGADVWGGFQVGQRFQLKSRTNGNQVMYMDSEPLLFKPAPFPAIYTNKRRIKMREPENSNDELWTYDSETGTLRSATNTNMVISVNPTTKAIIAEPNSANALKISYNKELFSLETGSGCIGWGETGLFQKACDETLTGQMWYPWYNYQTSGPWWNRMENY